MPVFTDRSVLLCFRDTIYPRTRGLQFTLPGEAGNTLQPGSSYTERNTFFQLNSGNQAKKPKTTQSSKQSLSQRCSSQTPSPALRTPYLVHSNRSWPEYSRSFFAACPRSVGASPVPRPAGFCAPLGRGAGPQNRYGVFPSVFLLLHFFSSLVPGFSSLGGLCRSATDSEIPHVLFCDQEIDVRYISIIAVMASPSSQQLLVSSTGICGMLIDDRIVGLLPVTIIVGSRPTQ
jgi:hypothetical protein